MKEHSRDLYDILNVGPTATGREIARAYRSLLRTHHPDTRPAGAVSGDAAAAARELHQIMDAYAVLSDPAHRADYDRGRQRHTPSLPPEAAPPRPHSSHLPVLIIGPVRWESPTVSAPGREPDGSSDTFPPVRRKARIEHSAPGWHWIIWRERP